MDLIDEPDAVLIREASSLCEKVALHTVPMYFFEGKAFSGRVKGVGSGVLVKLADHYFILTAGHCVEEAGDFARNEIAIGIQTLAHRFVPRLERRQFQKNIGSDVGYFEVQIGDAQVIEAKQKAFLSPKSLVVATSDEFRRRNDWMVISGFPARVIDGKQDLRSAQMVVYSTTIEGTGEAPPSGLLPPPNEETLDLWVPGYGNLETFPDKSGFVDVPLLRGASGGGCWLSNVRSTPSSWSPQRLKLAGIHTGSCESLEIGGKRHVFAREALVGQHLRLIASDYGDVRSLAGSEWPSLFEFDEDCVNDSAS